MKTYLTWLGLISCFMLTTSCGIVANSQPQSQQSDGRKSTAVDVAIASAADLKSGVAYIGTTAPIRTISLRSRTDGRLLNLNADVGDTVTEGQVIAQLDSGVLQAAVLRADAELAALESEVAQAQSEVSNAQTLIEQSRIKLQQAKSDAARFKKLAQSGVSTTQQAEQAETEAQTAEKVLSSAQEQVRSRQTAITAAKRRVEAQKALLTQAQEQLSYTRITSPANGAVLERVTEPGNLVQSGSEILKIGDFSQVKVIVQVSELELSGIRLNQLAKIKLDAFPNQEFTGRVERISPAADSNSRLVPVEVIIAGSQKREGARALGSIGAGLLARVSFTQSDRQNIVVSQSALEIGGAPKKAKAKGSQPSSPSSPAQNQSPKKSIIFVVTGKDKETKVAAREVKVGDRADGKVEILAGLQVGEKFVVKSAKPLKHEEAVVLSAISEK